MNNQFEFTYHCPECDTEFQSDIGIKLKCPGCGILLETDWTEDELDYGMVEMTPCCRVIENDNK
jgi:hypothetical protein